MSRVEVEILGGAHGADRFQDGSTERSVQEKDFLLDVARWPISMLYVV